MKCLVVSTKVLKFESFGFVRQGCQKFRTLIRKVARTLLIYLSGLVFVVWYFENVERTDLQSFQIGQSLWELGNVQNRSNRKLMTIDITST